MIGQVESPHCSLYEMQMGVKGGSGGATGGGGFGQGGPGAFGSPQPGFTGFNQPQQVQTLF